MTRDWCNVEWWHVWDGAWRQEKSHVSSVAYSCACSEHDHGQLDLNPMPYWPAFMMWAAFQCAIIMSRHYLVSLLRCSYEHRLSLRQAPALSIPHYGMFHGDWVWSPSMVGLMYHILTCVIISALTAGLCTRFHASNDHLICKLDGGV